MKILVIDTEGFGGIDVNSSHDSRIFLFSLLLSSMFIYNSVGNIDEGALSTLSLIVNFAPYCWQIALAFIAVSK